MYFVEDGTQIIAKNLFLNISLTFPVLLVPVFCDKPHISGDSSVGIVLGCQSLEISEILFTVFPAYPTVGTVRVLVKGARKLCIGSIHRAH